MIEVTELQDWLSNIKPRFVAIDDDGLTLVAIGLVEADDAYIEIGGIPDGEDEDEDEDAPVMSTEPRSPNIVVIAYTQDHVAMVKGMPVWVNNSVVGYPPKKRIVARCKSPLIVYFEPNDDDCAGAKTSSCWASVHKAMAHAIMEGTD